MNEDGSKTPFYITCADQPVFGFAGLWDSSRGDDGKALESCTIITMPPNPLLAEIHNVKQRMPAILQSEDINAWLAGSADEAQRRSQTLPCRLHGGLAGQPAGEYAPEQSREPDCAGRCRRHLPTQYDRRTAHCQRDAT